MVKVRGAQQKCHLDMFENRGRRQALERGGGHAKNCTCARDKHERVENFFKLLLSAEKYNKEEKDGNE